MIQVDSIVATIEDLVRMAPRATGTAGGAAAAAYVRDRFEAAGLDEVWIEECDSFRWTVERLGLLVRGESIPVSPILHSQLPAHDATGSWTTGADGITAEVVDVGRGRVRDVDVEGRIVLFDLRFTMTLASLLPLTEYVHDPSHQILRREVMGSRNPYVTTLTRVMSEAMAGGAVAVIGVLVDYPESNSYHNEYYRRTLLGLPGLWVTAAAGARLRELLEGDSPATFVLDNSRELVRAQSVLGVLHGRTHETIMIQSHHDSVGPGAVEDASGTAEVIAVAESEVQRVVGAGRRDKTLLFVTFDTHFTGYQAHREFACRYSLDPQSRFSLALNLTIEHVGLRARIGADRQFETVPETEPRAFFENVSLPMKRQLIRTIRRRSLHSTSMINASVLEFTANGIPTDASFTLICGVPTISLVSGPLYLYDDCDTIDQVDVDQLVPVGQAFIDLIEAADVRRASRLGLLPRRLRARLPRGRW